MAMSSKAAYAMMLALLVLLPIAMGTPEPDHGHNGGYDRPHHGGSDHHGGNYGHHGGGGSHHGGGGSHHSSGGHGGSHHNGGGGYHG